MSVRPTPGPWIITEADGELEISKAGAAFPVARIDGTDAEEWADAHLIAAAPDLLQALQFAADVARATPGFSPMALKQADTVLAKARGDQS